MDFMPTLFLKGKETKGLRVLKPYKKPLFSLRRTKGYERFIDVVIQNSQENNDILSELLLPGTEFAITAINHRELETNCDSIIQNFQLGACSISVTLLCLGEVEDDFFELFVENVWESRTKDETRFIV
jgi:hypothetical protein